MRYRAVVLTTLPLMVVHTPTFTLVAAMPRLCNFCGLCDSEVKLGSYSNRGGAESAEVTQRKGIVNE